MSDFTPLPSSVYWATIMSVRFILNGKAVQVDEIDPHVTLLAWLRGAGLTGAKEGCAEGECGACAIAVVQADCHGKPRLTPVNSCLVPLPAVHGQSLVSVEGIAADSGELHPVQLGMIERGGSQCGYCTPGFVVSLFCEYYRPGRSGYDPESISGNLCRCTGYRPIADVARELPLPDPSDARLVMLRDALPGPAPITHRSGQYRFVRPESLAHVFELLAQEPGATLLSGGTDLFVYANQRFDRWDTLIALGALPELQQIEVRADELVLGAGIPLAQLEERMEHDASLHVPLLARLWPLFSSRLIRNRATLGGNLGTASPIGDSSPALLALDASVTLSSASAERRVALREFFLDYRKTRLAPGELIRSVHIPLPLAAIQRFYKVSKRVLDDISTVSAAFTLRLSARDEVERLHVAYGGVAATPIRAIAVEQLAVGKPWSIDTLRVLLTELERLGTPISDPRGSSEYRRAMMGKLLEKFFAETAQVAEAAQ